jgi:fucose permease
MEWICPIIVWTLFFGAFVFIFALVGSVFYKRWSEADCLTFGMTVPIVSTANMGESQGQKGYDFKNKLFLLGGGISQHRLDI